MMETNQKGVWGELFPRTSRRGMQALHALTAVQTGHGNSDPGQNEDRTSARLCFCLLEVTSDLQNFNHHLPHITFTWKSTLGTVSLKKRQYL